MPRPGVALRTPVQGVMYEANVGEGSRARPLTSPRPALKPFTLNYITTNTRAKGEELV